MKLRNKHKPGLKHSFMLYAWILFKIRWVCFSTVRHVKPMIIGSRWVTCSKPKKKKKNYHDKISTVKKSTNQIASTAWKFIMTFNCNNGRLCANHFWKLALIFRDDAVFLTVIVITLDEFEGRTLCPQSIWQPIILRFKIILNFWYVCNERKNFLFLFLLTFRNLPTICKYQLFNVH
jgi:hypothetical protein